MCLLRCSFHHRECPLHLFAELEELLPSHCELDCRQLLVGIDHTAVTTFLGLLFYRGTDLRELNKVNVHRDCDVEGLSSLLGDSCASH